MIIFEYFIPKLSARFGSFLDFLPDLDLANVYGGLAETVESQGACRVYFLGNFAKVLDKNELIATHMARIAKSKPAINIVSN
jgi:hypothetical protein